MYGSGFFLFFGSLFGLIFYFYGYEPSTCFDKSENGWEAGVDCGGKCVRICSIDTLPPKERWVQTFRSSKGLYNVVAYVDNKNQDAGVEALSYTVSLYDKDGLIAEQDGVTSFAPKSLVPFFEGRIETGNRTPTRVSIAFDPNPIWVPATVGQVQYKTERRTLTGAGKEPILSATLRNESLEELRNVEVVATIFDVNGNPLTASRTRVPTFHARSTEDVTFTWQDPIATTLRSCELPTEVILGIDVSGSMNDDWANPPEPISSVLTAARSFVERLNLEDSIGVVTYATEATLQTLLTSAHDTVAKSIGALTISKPAETGSTNTGDAIRLALEEFTSSRNNDDARKVFILLTDGLATSPDPDPEEYALQASRAIKAANVEVFTIGVGTKVNEDFLKEIATDEKHYFLAPQRTTIGRIYEDITTAICEDGPAVIDILPKPYANFTPLR
jgi:Mg-chelatase subunit ChlD